MGSRSHTRRGDFWRLFGPLKALRVSAVVTLRCTQQKGSFSSRLRHDMQRDLSSKFINQFWFPWQPYIWQGYRLKSVTDRRTDGRTNGRQIDLTSNSALAYNTAQQRRNVQWKHTHLFSYEIISIFYWKLQQELSIASGRIKKILAPYETDGRLFTTDVSANFKVTWHKK